MDYVEKARNNSQRFSRVLLARAISRYGQSRSLAQDACSKQPVTDNGFAGLERTGFFAPTLSAGNSIAGGPPEYAQAARSSE